MTRSQIRCTFQPHFIAILLLFSVLVSGCAGKEETSAARSTLTIALPNTPAATATIKRPTALPPTSTPTLIPASPNSSDEMEAGLIILAMADGPYKHLFAYHPVYLPLTRLTADAWDYDDPAISPDGSKIAYCANEFGRWDIFILDLLNGEKTRLTQTETYACAPSWSPDGVWLAYESVQDTKLGIILQSVSDTSSAPVPLTDNLSNNFDPTWSPGGREIAFVTDRNGRQEIWLADLDASEDRFSPVASSDDADYSSPDWSLNGDAMVWVKTVDFPQVEKLKVTESDSGIMTLGMGIVPTWVTNNSGVAAILRSPNGYDLVSYRNDPTRLLYPPIHLSQQVSAIDWKPGSIVQNIRQYLSFTSLPETTEILQPQISSPDTDTGRYDLKYLEDIEVTDPYLSDSIDETFFALRTAVENELGWDYLGILENADFRLPASPQPDFKENWLYTGRAIAVNMDPLDAGWMAVSREDYNGRTYWRIWLKCKDQDGTCGAPLKEPVWDFDARFNGDLSTYEEGGAYGPFPGGYWIDFTGFALDYGWERLPAESNWRGYFPATQLGIFVQKDNLTWREAMLELYPVEMIEALLQ